MIVEDSSLLGVKLDFQPYYQMQIQSIEDDYRGFQPWGWEVYFQQLDLIDVLDSIDDSLNMFIEF